MLIAQPVTAQPPVYPESDLLKDLPDVVAVIEGVPITAETYRKAVQLAALREAGEGATELNVLPALTPSQEYRVLRMLVETQAMSIIAQDSDIIIDNDKLDQLIAAEKQRMGGQEAFDKMLEQTGMTELQFRGLRRTQIKQRLYSRRVVEQVSIDEEQVQEQYRKLKSEGKLHAPDRVAIRHILVKPADDTDEAWDAAKEAIENARKRIVDGGEDFGLVASEISDEATTATKGGKLLLPRTDDNNEFQNVAFGLKDGEVCQPFKSAVGWHLIKSERHIGEGDLPYDEARPRLHQQMLNAKRVQALRAHVLTKMKSMDIQFNVDPPEGAAQGGDADDDESIDTDAIQQLLQ